MTTDVLESPLKLNSLVYCKDSARDKIRELLAEELCKVSGEVDDECERQGPPKATTDQFKCGWCGKRKCTYYQL